MLKFAAGTFAYEQRGLLAVIPQEFSDGNRPKQITEDGHASAPGRGCYRVESIKSVFWASIMSGLPVFRVPPPLGFFLGLRSLILSGALDEVFLAFEDMLFFLRRFCSEAFVPLINIFALRG